MTDSIYHNRSNSNIPHQEQPDLELQRKVVKVYDSSPLYTFNSMAGMFKRTPQRLQQIHAKYPHECTRKAFKKGKHDNSK